MVASSISKDSPPCSLTSPAKKRKLDTERFASTALAREIGFPVSLLSSAATSSCLASRASAILSSQEDLSVFVSPPQSGWAEIAASTALSTSFCPDIGALANAAPVAGSSTSSHSPLS